MPHILNFSNSFRNWRKIDTNSFRIYKNCTNKFCNKKISIIQTKMTALRRVSNLLKIIILNSITGHT
jgi:hypothetical protein